MFGSSNGKDDKKTKTDNSSSSSSRSSSPSCGHGLNTITEGTRIEGDLTANSDIRIDGYIKGTLRSTAKVIIGVKGSVEGEVSCDNAVIEGSFTGKLKVKDMLQLKETAKVDGEIATNRLAMAAGCAFSGNIDTSVKGNSNNPLVADHKQKDRAGIKA